MSFMFLFAESFTGTGMESWDVSSAQSLFGLVHGAASFNEDISDWDVSAATDFTAMLQGATSFNADLCAWASKISDPDASLINAFQGTACPDTSDPDLSSSPAGPFCVPC